MLNRRGFPESRIELLYEKLLQSLPGWKIQWNVLIMKIILGCSGAVITTYCSCSLAITVLPALGVCSALFSVSAPLSHFLAACVLVGTDQAAIHKEHGAFNLGWPMHPWKAILLPFGSGFNSSIRHCSCNNFSEDQSSKVEGRNDSGFRYAF